MRRPSFYRGLRSSEKTLCDKVFNGSLPSYEQIGIGDGLGIGDNPWTDWGADLAPDRPKQFYHINVGDFASMDLSQKVWTPYDGDTSDLLIHEMAHVWQYYYGWTVKASSLWANTFGDGYTFTAGDPWDDYNSEQQASIVEKWHQRGHNKRDELYPYIVKIIWSGGKPELTELTLKELAADVYVPPDPPPNPTFIPIQPIDSTLVPILEKRYAANDIAGFSGRVKRLEEIFGSLNQLEAQHLLDRLVVRRREDRVSNAFHHALSSATITKLLNILRQASRPIMA